MKTSGVEGKGGGGGGGGEEERETTGLSYSCFVNHAVYGSKFKLQSKKFVCKKPP